jgi:hypothetical protein
MSPSWEATLQESLKGIGNESAGNPSPAPPHRSKGPGVSAGRYRLTGACPTVVTLYLRKVDAARRIAPDLVKKAVKTPILCECGKTGRRADCRQTAKVVVKRMAASARAAQSVHRPHGGAVCRRSPFAGRLRAWYIGKFVESQTESCNLRGGVCP